MGNGAAGSPKWVKSASSMGVSLEELWVACDAHQRLLLTKLLFDLGMLWCCARCATVNVGLVTARPDEWCEECVAFRPTTAPDVHAHVSGSKPALPLLTSGA